MDPVPPSSLTLRFEFNNQSVSHRVTEQDFLEKDVIFGRGRSARHCLDAFRDRCMSRSHFQVSLLEGRFWIADNNSLLGTWLNGKLVAKGMKRPLAPDDRIRMGRTTAVVTDVQPRPTRRHDVFLSHSTPDKAEVRKLAADLAGEGIAYFLDEWDLRPGHIWLEQLNTALKESAVLIFCLGSSKIGPWAEIEASMAFQQMVSSGGKLRIIPILLPTYTLGEDAPSLPPSLQLLQWVDLREKDQAAQRLRLLESIHDQIRVVDTHNPNPAAKKSP